MFDHINMKNAITFIVFIQNCSGFKILFVIQSFNNFVT